MVKIDIKRTGFPVTLGEIELWFDSSIENLKKFINVEEVAKKRLEEVSKQNEHIHFPEEINEETIHEMTDEEIEGALSLNKEYIAIQYDVLFGDGAFKKIYGKYPDVYALEETFEVVAEAINERLEEEVEKRSDKYNQAKKELLNKKKQKKK